MAISTNQTNTGFSTEMKEKPKESKEKVEKDKPCKSKNKKPLEIRTKSLAEE